MKRSSFRELIAATPLPKHELWPLLEAASGRPREFILAHDTDLVDVGAQALFLRWIGQRQAGVPLAYLVGGREFYGRNFWVNDHTLIPRMETELLIDTVKDLLGQHGGGGLRFCDLGTGSGCIGITLALEFPQAQVYASDISGGALQVARNNAVWLGAGPQMRFYQGAWWQALGQAPATFHGIVSNPPYIAPGDQHLSQGDLRFEPAQALVGQGNGLDDIRTIAGGAINRLEPNGFLLIEHGFDQQAAVMGVFQQAGLIRVRGLTDLAKNPRAVLGFRGSY